MKKQFAIISHDRHRDDYVYLVKCEEKDVKNHVKKIWEKDFNFTPDEVEDNYCSDGSGDYLVEVAILKEL